MRQNRRTASANSGPEKAPAEQVMKDRHRQRLAHRGDGCNSRGRTERKVASIGEFRGHIPKSDTPRLGLNRTISLLAR